MFQNIFL